MRQSEDEIHPWQAWRTGRQTLDRTLCDAYLTIRKRGKNGKVIHTKG